MDSARLSGHQQRVESCVALAGPMPDPAAHRRYLQGLNDAQLEDRAAALADQNKPRFVRAAAGALVNFSR